MIIVIIIIVMIMIMIIGIITMTMTMIMIMIIISSSVRREPADCCDWMLRRPAKRNVLCYKPVILYYATP